MKTHDILSHYRLTERVGAGGMGEVWRAEDLNLEGRVVAIKVLPPEATSDEGRRAQFRAEARLSLAIAHANVVRVFELGRQDGQDFLVMEFVRGQTLSQVLADGPVAPSAAVSLGLQIARGMAEAHRRGVLHRDLNPANIIVTAEHEARIVDFGLASLSARTLRAWSPDAPTQTWAHILQDSPRDASHQSLTTAGTLAYMSPEQVRGLPLDHRSDIFSLGVILYEMLAARRPFPGPTTADLIHQILVASPTPVRLLAPQVTPLLDSAISKALAGRPDDRYQSMDALADALEGASIVAEAGTPVPAPVVAAQAPKHRRLYVLVLVSLLAVLAAGWRLWGGPWWARRHEFREDFAQPDKNTLLANGWVLLNPDPDLWDRPDAPGCVSLFTHRGDTWNAKELVVPVKNVLARRYSGSRFQATTLLKDFHPEHNYQQAGLLLLVDQDNYVRLTLAASDGELRVQGIFERAGVVEKEFLEPPALDFSRPDTIWLQIIRDRDEFVLRYRSTDVRPWSELGRYSMPLPQRYIALAAFHGITENLPDNLQRVLSWEPLEAKFDFLEVEGLQ